MTKEEKQRVVSTVKFSLLKEYSASGLDDEVINDCIDATIKALNIHRVDSRRGLLVADLKKVNQPIITLLEIADYERAADYLLGNL